MRALVAAATLALLLASLPSAAAQDPGGDCDGTVDVACDDPWGTPGGTTCIVAVGGRCLAWTGGGLGGACDGTVDVLCADPWGTPGGSTCIVAAGGRCLAWV